MDGERPKEINFLFQKRTNGIHVLNFKCPGYVEPREIDAELRPIEAHTTLKQASVLKSLEGTASTKQLTFSIDDDSFDDYLNGNYTEQYDRRHADKERWTRTGAIPRHPTAAARAPGTLSYTGEDMLNIDGGRSDVHDAVSSAAETQATTSPQDLQSLLVMNMIEMRRENAEMRKQMEHQTASMHSEMLRVMQQLSLNEQKLSSGDNRMEITKFDGTFKSEEPNAWITYYETVCENNGWRTDSQKVNHLKSNFVPHSAADNWFSGRMMEHRQDTWNDWKEAFVLAFMPNMVDAAKSALSYSYQGGRVLDWFYEKERRLRIAISDISDKGIITLSTLGLPPHMQTQVMTMDVSNKASFVVALQKLVPIRSRDGVNSVNPVRNASNKGAWQQSTHVRHERNDTGNQQQHYWRSPQQIQQQYYNSNRSHGQHNQLQPRASWQESRPAYQSNTSRPAPQQQLSGSFNRPSPAPASKPQSSLVVNLPSETKKEEPKVLAIGSEHLPVHPVLANGKQMHALFDSGSERNLISLAAAKSLACTLEQRESTVIDFNSTPFKANHVAQLPLSIHPDSPLCRDPKTVVMELFLVFESLPYDLLISNQTLAKFGIELALRPSLTAMITNSQSGSVTDMQDAKQKFPELFRESFTPKYSVSFEVSTDQPVSCKPYRLSPVRSMRVQEKMTELLDRGKIEHSSSAFAAPIVVVDKPNGDIRVCVNYADINRVTTLDPFPFPRIDCIISNYGGCRWFSSIDLAEGFAQVGLTPETRHVAAFVTPTDHFNPTVLPYGWKNSPAKFQRIMTHSLGHLLFDPRISVQIGANEKRECEQLTFLVMDCLAKHGFTVNERKSKLIQKSIVLLGRSIDGLTKTTKQESIEKVKQMKQPVDRKGVQQLTGL